MIFASKPEERGVEVFRDKSTLHAGDLISERIYARNWERRSRLHISKREVFTFSILHV